MKFARAVLSLALVGVAAAEERDPVEVLARFGPIVRENVARMSGLVCRQTIERRYYRAKLAGSPRNCDDLAAEKKRRGYRLDLESSDRVRLDVRAGATSEMYSWPDADFEYQQIWDVIGYGPAATGPFAMLALQVAQGDANDFAFKGETELAGRKLYEYSFRVPVERSHYSIYIGQRAVATAWSGTLLIDPATFELVRLTSRTSELPPEAFSCEISTLSDFGRESFLGRELLMSRETRQRFVPRSGAEVESLASLSSCREYQPLSNVGPSYPAERAWLDLPPGLHVSIELSEPIDSATAAAGDRFTGKVSEPILDSAGGVLVPGGSTVAGRLVKVAVRARPAEVAIVLHVDAVRIGGADVPIHLAGRFVPKHKWLLDLLSTLRVGAGSPGSSAGAGDFSVTYTEGSDEEYNAFSFPGERKILERGFGTEWRTVTPRLK